MSRLLQLVPYWPVHVLMLIYMVNPWYFARMDLDKESIMEIEDE